MEDLESFNLQNRFSSMAISSCAIDHLPEEIVIEILSWMPVKSLLRFRTVCKSWQSIISNQGFIKTHLDHTSTIKSTSIIVLNYNRGSFSTIYCNSLTNCINLQLPRPLFYIQFISSCNGIVCLCNGFGDMIYLWNPSTKQCKSLPRPRYLAPGRPSVYSSKFSLWFGFDSVSGDYKVLRIVKPVTCVVAELYSMNADSWREIAFHTQSSARCYSCGTIINEVLYLISTNELVSFNFQNEVFGVYALPCCVLQERKSDLLDFKGSLAMVLNSVDDESLNGRFTLWAMTNVCGNVSWSKQFTFEAASEIDWVSMYLSSGQFVALKKCERLMSYDYKKKEILNFQLSTQGIIFAVINHKESLVSFKGSRCFQYNAEDNDHIRVDSQYCRTGYRSRRKQKLCKRCQAE